MKFNFVDNQFDPLVDDPTNYKWNVFYYNLKDKRLVVPKRNRILGLTLNFANPYALYWVIGIFLFIFSAFVMGYLV
ncbi:MAG: hypothetical protein ABSD71_14320 [Bacteroidales bacterium]